MAHTRFSWRPLLLGFGLILVVLLTVTIVRAWRIDSKQIETERADLQVSAKAPQRLGQILQVRTLAKRDPTRLDSAAYTALYDALERFFPRVHSTLDPTTVNGLSRLYRWEGRDPSLSPIVLMAHVDVVPVDDSTAWRYPPFSGRIADGYVWGRGALDDKSSAVGILEAIETLLQQGVTPERTVYVALGHDEEVGGTRGAQVLAERILQKEGAPALVLDEGGAITRGALPGLNDPLAVVGVAGKGYLSLELEAERPGGHSSVPPDRTSIEVLNEGLTRLLERPLSSQLSGVTGTTFDYLAPEMSLVMRSLLANRWVTAPVLRWVLNQRPATRAAIRTTTAPTRLDAGVKDNVIPTTARAVVNFRILPSQSVEGVKAHVRAALRGLPVEIEVEQSGSPSPVSKIEGQTFRVLQRTIGQVTADSVVVAPYLIPGRTDSRYYAEESEYVYRFVPYQLTPDDQSRIHGQNERISIEDYRTVVRFYMQVIRNAETLPERGNSTEDP